MLIPIRTISLRLDSGRTITNGDGAHDQSHGDGDHHGDGDDRNDHGDGGGHSNHGDGDTDQNIHTAKRKNVEKITLLGKSIECYSYQISTYISKSDRHHNQENSDQNLGNHKTVQTFSNR